MNEIGEVSMNRGCGVRLAGYRLAGQKSAGSLRKNGSAPGNSLSF